MGFDGHTPSDLDRPDDEETREDIGLAPPRYRPAPATIQETRSPFHPSAAEHAERGVVPRMAPRTPTAVGMPPPSLSAEISWSDGPTAPDGIQFATTIDRVDVSRGRPPEALPPDGPTVPDGVPYIGVQVVGAPVDGPTDPDGVAFSASPSGSGWAPAPVAASVGLSGPSGFGGPPPRREPPRPTPEVPAPNTPNVLVSPSMEMQVGDFDSVDVTAAPSIPAAQRRGAPRAPRVRHGGAQAPTEVMLPALKREKKRAEKEGSDWPLILGLGALAILILGLIGAVVFGVLRSVDSGAEAAPSAPVQPASADPAPADPASPAP